jgi:type I restriction enzyme, S subunit
MLHNDIGPIPAGWQIKTLPDVCSMQSGGTPPKSEPALWAGELPWVSGKDLKAHRLKDAVDHITLEAAETYSKIAPAGSVLVLVRGMGLANGFAVSVIARPMAFNQDLKALIPKGDGSGSFLMYALTFAGERMLRNVADAAHGTKRLSQDDLDTFRLAIPDPDEQRLIARVLDIAVEAANVEKRAGREAQELKRAAMRELFTRGLRGEPRKETELGPIPESWEVVPFPNAASIAEGQVDPKMEPYASMLHVGPESVERDTGRLLDCKTAKEMQLISGKYLFKPGDVIYSKIRPYLRKAILASFAGICSADMYPLTPKSGFNGHFIHGYLLSDVFTRQAVSQQDRTGIPKLNREQLNSILMPKPDPSEQTAIASILDAIDRKIDLHKRKRAVLEELFKTLLHKLMTGEIRVSDLDLSALPPAAPAPQEASV